MSIDLSSYHRVKTGLFVKLDIPNYNVLRFSDYYQPFTIGSDTYDSLGQLMNVTDTTSELRATAQEITITISGIPTSRIQEILGTRLKGSQVDIKRVFFNADTGAMLDIDGNPASKFRGIITNFSILDDAGSTTDNTPGTITLTMTATSVVEILEKKIAGRRTNPIDQRALYPGDACFDRVPNLANSSFNFGAPK